MPPLRDEEEELPEGVEAPLAAALAAAAAASLAASLFPATLRAEMTFPKANKLLLIAPVSRSIPPAEPLSPTRSEPAKSTKIARP